MTGYTDADNDGVTTGGPVEVCTDGTALPSGFLADSTGDACDDANKNVHTLVSGWLDADKDRYTSATEQETLCTDGSLPSGYVLDEDLLGTDCDDGNAAVHTEVSAWVDADKDGYTIGTEPVLLCTDGKIPSGYQANKNGLDCNDGDGAVHTLVSGWADKDGDLYTAATEQETHCTDGTLPAGYVSDDELLGEDCDDEDANVHTEIEAWVDGDNDGYTVGIAPVTI